MAFNPELYCLALLKRRLRSRSELQQALTRKGVEPVAQEEVLNRLEELKLVDDRHYTRAWIRTRDRLTPRGEAVLRQELYQKGIPKEIIEEALAERREQAADEESDQPSEFELAKNLVEGKSRMYSHLPEEKRRQRIAGLLQRRGFSYEVIRRILNA